MFAFVIPFRSPESVKNWELVSAYCIRTLISCTKQKVTNDLYQIILVCNKKPLGIEKIQEKNLILIEEKFDTQNINDPKHQMIDKYQKLKRGLIEAEKIKANKIMFLDADDCIHEDLLPFVLKKQNKNSNWLCTKGYILDESKKILIIKKKEFNLLCGSCAIINVTPHDLPKTMEDPRENFFLLTQGHPIIHHYFEKKGTPMKSIPFPAALYTTNYGNSYSNYSTWKIKSRLHLLLSLFKIRPLTPKIINKFGAYPIPQHQ